MRTRILIILHTLCAQFIIGQDSLIVKYVDYDVQTVVSISCENFEGEFPDEFETTRIFNKEAINKLMGIVSTLEEDDNNYIPDIRLAIDIFSSQRLDRLCLGKFGVIYNGEIKEFSKALFLYIETLKFGDLLIESVGEDFSPGAEE